MFLVLIRQKRKISQLLFLYDLLNKNYFQAETKKYITSGCHLCASHWSTESTSINHGTGRRMKLPPSWLSFPPALHVTPSLWSLMTFFWARHPVTNVSSFAECSASGKGKR